MARTGVVAIGRNEGERLRRCLESLDPSQYPIVYVDSGSTDGSPEMARSLGVVVVPLDMNIPFTAARARNEGFAKLREVAPDLTYVQFVDGDCEVVRDWITHAEQELDRNAGHAVVCGRRRERYPDRTIWNRLCDIEWDTPIGETKAAGGDALMRIEAVVQVNGYNSAVIAAEDDDICLRMRHKGWKIRRIDAEMTIHDAAMTRMRQWWKRAVRCGYAYALGAYLHGKPPERHFVSQRRKAILWGFVIPLILLALAWPTYGLSLLGFLIYPLQMLRIARRMRHLPRRQALAWGISCMASKFPEFQGICRFVLNPSSRIIEYK